MKRPVRKGGAVLRACILLTPVLLVYGCKNGDTPGLGTIRQEPAEDVIAKINANSQAMDFVLKASGSASAEVRDRDGKIKRFDGSSVMFFQRPGRLYMNLEPTLGGEIQIGSNESEFFFWDKLSGSNPRYLWGEHALMSDNLQSADMPIRPDYLAEVMGLIYVPAPGTTAEGPFFRALDKDYELVFLGTTSGGRQYISRAVRIPRSGSNYLVKEILFYRSDGYPALTAGLSDYRPIQDSSAQIPYRIEMRWGKDQFMELDLSSASRHGNQAAGEALLQTTPRLRGEELGYVERIDLPSLPTPALPGGQETPAP